MNNQCVMIKSWEALVKEHGGGGFGYMIERCPIGKTLQIRHIESGGYISRNVITALSNRFKVIEAHGYYLERDYSDGVNGLIVCMRVNGGRLYRVPFGCESLFLSIAELNPRLYLRIVMSEF